MLDYVIVDACISGCYLAYMLYRSNPNLSIVILEGSNRIGGRLLSKKLEGSTYDLGGMRFSKSSHVLVRSMLDDLGIEYEPIKSNIQGSRSMSKMLDDVRCVGDQGFVTYSWNHGYDPIRMSIKQGYDIIMDDITLKLLYLDNKIVPDWNRVPIGFQNVCKILVSSIPVMLSSKVISIEDNNVKLKDGNIIQGRHIIYTGQPDGLTKLTGLDYISSLISYSALRIYIPYKTDCIVGTSTKLPLRKIQTIGNALLVYCDSQSSYYLSLRMVSII